MESALRTVRAPAFLSLIAAVAIAAAILWDGGRGTYVGAAQGREQAVAASSPNIGVNLEGLSDWARMKPFADLMKTSRPWGTADAPWNHMVPLDPQGWPTTDAGVVVAVQKADEGDPSPAYRYMVPGVYALSFAGRATVSPVASDGVSIRNYRYDAAANRSTAEVVIGGHSPQLMLAFRGTKGGVRDVSLLLPGYAGTAKTFTDEFLAAIRPFRTLRFMDWLATNGNPVRHWHERTLPGSATQASSKGVAYDYITQLANEADKDIWINIPANADDDYVRRLALLLKERLEPGRAVYVEYSNEVWNGIFAQSEENARAAVAEALAGDSSLTKGTACTAADFDRTAGDCNRWWAGHFRVGKKIVGISRIFAEVWGQGAINGRVRPIYASQFADRNMAEQVLRNIARYRGTPTGLIYGLATAPYYYLDPVLAKNDGLTEDAILASLERSLDHDVLPFLAPGTGDNGSFTQRRPYRGGDWTSPSQKALADYYGLRSLAYEGGPDFLQSSAGLAAKFRASTGPRGAAQLRRYVERWQACGHDLYVHFALTSPYGSYGYWGLTNDPQNLGAPKYAVLARQAVSPAPPGACA